MYRTDRLATLGELAAEAAHEIRNPLTAIHSTIQYLSKDFKNDPVKSEMITELISEVERINKIVQGLLSFARPSALNTSDVNVEQLINQTLTLTTNALHKQNISIEFEYFTENTTIRADAEQLKQVFLNIILNATEAMSENETDKERTLIISIEKGAYDFIEKPFDNDALLLTVRRAIEHGLLKKEIKDLKKQLNKNTISIIGENGGLCRIMEQVQKVAETDATVLIHGESGTGKELIARTLHLKSKRSDRPFIAVNCGAIPLSLMESELFGHEKGAFTDAKETQAGTFERANGGTLFLDEIGELPLDAQVKLLRVLEDRTITRIGGKKTIPVDVRIITATNRNLEEEVKLGKFRLDLLYRLNIFTLMLPPLRERKEDIPLLVDYFIRKYNKTLHLSVQTISPETMNRLCGYNWPGNVRDLENAIQSAMILCIDGIIRLEHLPGRIKGYEQVEMLSIPKNEGNNIREINAQVEKELILETLRKHNYNRTLTAEDLNISRKTLFNKMKRYGLDNV